MRITGHIDYSACTPVPLKHRNPPQVDGSAAIEPHHVVGRRVGRPSADIPNPDKMYAWLLEVAVNDERAPQLHELREKFGHHAQGVLRSLVLTGRVVIEIGAVNYRVMYLPADKAHTLMPPKFRAYRRIDDKGTYWRSLDGKRWEQRS